MRSFLQEALARYSEMGLDPSALGGIASQVGSAGQSAQAAIAQGQSLFQNANVLSKGNLGALTTAASGIISELPPGQVRDALSELEGAGEGALAGAAIGSIIPGWGTAIGAVVGAIIGFAESIVSSPPVVEGDPRPTAEQYMFPATANAAPYSLIPYNVVHPRVLPGSIGPGLPFYQCAQVIDPTTNAPSLNTTWSFLYNFGVTWTRPPQVKGVTKPSPNSQQAAWALCQWHEGVDRITKAFALNPSLPNAALQMQRAQAVQKAKVLTGILLGGDDVAQKAFNRLSELYGAPESFNPLFPNGPDADHPPPALFPSMGLWQMTGDLPVVGGSSAALIGNTVKAATKYPLDWTYYLRGARWDSGGQSVNRDTPAHWNIGLWFADPLRLSMAECAVLEYPDLSVFHFLLSLMWLEKGGHRYDAIQWGPPAVKHHPNLARLVGRVGERVKQAARQSKKSSGPAGRPMPAAGAPAAGAAGPKVATHAKSVHSTVSVHSLPTKSGPPWPLIVVGGALGVGAITLLARKSR